MSEKESNDLDEADQKKLYQRVKSTAVVKYSAALAPAKFTQLQYNTNLNLPPANWLSDSVSVYGVQPYIMHQSGFSSFRMAHMLPDCVGEVDVISDAENIKKLLKIAYTRSGPISLLIHRVQNTLLIDEFDVKKVLLASGGRWEWFKKFFERVIELKQKKKQGLEYKDKSRTALQQRSLASKFLYHSLVIPEKNEQVESELRSADPNIAIPLPFNEEPPLPEPELEQELPDPGHKFSRNVIWTFEDIQMLLGTDMPIFGGGTHPCVSLRLRDTNKPINVLTGLDYWLDNLMCNVPEVVMCFHLNGIVQRYELIKTEDLPHLPNSRFSPKVIRDIAKNILSFLKTNATKAGHTYWLFKGHNDDVVKLYDLTSLCTDDALDDNGQTPFTVPVAILLYRVARNMKSSTDGRKQHASTIRMLLDNCISIMPAEKYPEIITSAHFMLADLYIPSDLDVQHPSFDDTDEQTEADFDVQEEDTSAASPVKTISLEGMRVERPEGEHGGGGSSGGGGGGGGGGGAAGGGRRPAPLPSDFRTRCSYAMQHVIKGIRRLAPAASSPEPETASPNVSIPMHYQSLNEVKRSNRRNKKKTSNAVVTSNQNNLCRPTDKEDWSWDLHLKTLLFEKARLIELCRMEWHFTEEEIGTALGRGRTAERIQAVLRQLKKPIIDPSGESLLYTRCGDGFFRLVSLGAERIALEDEAYRREIYEDLDLEPLLKQDLSEIFPKILDSLETVLSASVGCYTRASLTEPNPAKLVSVRRRLGNVENELGAFYMDQATTYFKTSEPDLSVIPKINELLAKAEKHLTGGARAFEATGDATNLALLLSNTGRLWRIRAHASSETDCARTAAHERQCYNTAIAHYLHAVEVLHDRLRNPTVWDSVYWELSTAYFTIASLLQDYPAGVKSLEEAEREVIDVLHKALKYCDLETSGLKLPVYQFRAAQIHRRLASLHHSQLRNGEMDENRKKYILQLCKLHYEKAAKFFMQLKHVGEFLTVQMERVGLAENLAKNSTKNLIKQKHYQFALGLIQESKPILQVVIDKNQTDIEEQEEQENIIKLVSLMQRQLQFILQSLTKITSGSNKSNLGNKFREAYLIALRNNSTSHDAVEVTASLITVIEEIEKNPNLAVIDHN